MRCVTESSTLAKTALPRLGVPACLQETTLGVFLHACDNPSGEAICPRCWVMPRTRIKTHESVRGTAGDPPRSDADHWAPSSVMRYDVLAREERTRARRSFLIWKALVVPRLVVEHEPGLGGRPGAGHAGSLAVRACRPFLITLPTE